MTNYRSHSEEVKKVFTISKDVRKRFFLKIFCKIFTENLIFKSNCKVGEL